MARASGMTGRRVGTALGFGSARVVRGGVAGCGGREAGCRRLVGVRGRRVGTALGFGRVAAECVGALRGGADGGAGGSRRPGDRLRVGPTTIRSCNLAFGSSAPGSGVSLSRNSFVHSSDVSGLGFERARREFVGGVSMRGRELGLVCADFRSGCSVALLRIAGASVPSGRDIGAGTAQHFQDKKPLKLSCSAGGVNVGIAGERPGSSQRGRAMAQTWQWAAAKRFRGTRSTLVSATRTHLRMQPGIAPDAEKG